MERTVTASHSEFSEDGSRCFVTEYTGSCGCFWSVDMWGRVRVVSVCEKCLDVRYPWEDQLLLFPGDS